jgi:hypothetical protein
VQRHLGKKKKSTTKNLFKKIQKIKARKHQTNAAMQTQDMIGDESNVDLRLVSSQQIPNHDGLV